MSSILCLRQPRRWVWRYGYVPEVQIFHLERNLLEPIALIIRYYQFQDWSYYNFKFSDVQIYDKQRYD